MTAPPTLTAAQVRQACALLRWSSPTLAERSGVAYEALCLAWREDCASGMSAHDLAAIRTTLERAGGLRVRRRGAEVVDSPSL